MTGYFTSKRIMRRKPHAKCHRSKIDVNRAISPQPHRGLAFGGCITRRQSEITNSSILLCATHFNFLSACTSRSKATMHYAGNETPDTRRVFVGRGVVLDAIFACHSQNSCRACKRTVGFTLVCSAHSLLACIECTRFIVLHTLGGWWVLSVSERDRERSSLMYA